MIRKIRKAIADFIFGVAKNAAGAASTWSTYEPEMPECLIDSTK